MAEGDFDLGREAVRGSLQALATLIEREYLPPNWGFAVMMFEFTTEPGGNMQWLSNAERSDMIKLIREFANKLEARQAGGPDDEPGSKV